MEEEMLSLLAQNTGQKTEQKGEKNYGADPG
jgi:hypothetical protein